MFKFHLSSAFLPEANNTNRMCCFNSMAGGFFPFFISISSLQFLEIGFLFYILVLEQTKTCDLYLISDPLACLIFSVLGDKHTLPYSVLFGED